MKRRRPGKNVAPALAQRFRLPAILSVPGPVALAEFLSENLFPNILAPQL